MGDVIQALECALSLIADKRSNLRRIRSNFYAILKRNVRYAFRSFALRDERELFSIGLLRLWRSLYRRKNIEVVAPPEVCTRMRSV